MSGNVLRIPVPLYKRLELHAQGVDTPVGIIEKYLNYYEEHANRHPPALSEPQESPSKLEVVFCPNNEKVFKELLVTSKHAWVLLQKSDGTSEMKEWNAHRFGKDSHLTGNLRSGCLRNWKEDGIVRATVAINKDDVVCF